MPRESHKYRLHKASGRAFVQFKGKRIFLGKYGTDESFAAYRRVCDEFHASGDVPAVSVPTAAPAGLSVNELMIEYLTRHVDSHYLKNGKPTSEPYHIRYALRPLKSLFGATPVADFGPLKLERTREEFIKGGLIRISVNKHIGRIRRMFKWGVAKQLVPPTVFQGLACLDGLRAGRTKAKEAKPVAPVEAAFIEKTLPYLNPQVAAMVRLQLLTGARPGEVCIVRPRDIAKGEDGVWIFIPESHKTQHHDKERRIHIGPQAQAVLAPWLDRDPDSYCFSPREVRTAMDAQRKTNRKTPMTPSQARRRPLRRPLKEPGERYTPMTYSRAIKDACGKAKLAELVAGGATKQEAKAALKKLKSEGNLPTWRPNQLRHTRATELRRKYGIEVAQCILGHTKLTTTEIYAERDFERAAEVMKEIG